MMKIVAYILAIAISLKISVTAARSLTKKRQQRRTSLHIGSLSSVLRQPKECKLTKSTSAVSRSRVVKKVAGTRN
jgi:hypothetical protein